MAELHLAVVPAGKFKSDDIDSAVLRASKVLRAPIEVREAIHVPRGAEDAERGQHRAVTLLALLRTAALQTRPGKLVGGTDADTKAPFKPDAWIFVIDVDIFTAKTDGVFAVVHSAKNVAMISVKRLREAFYRRPADPGRQRARLTKEILRMAGRLSGLTECASAECPMATSRSVPDLDQKSETYCRSCSQRLFEGKIQV